jgi:plastocyanin
MSAMSSVTYPSLTFQPLPAASSGSETLTLNGTAPAGLTLKFSKDTVKLTTDVSASVVMMINSSQSLAPGDYKVTVAVTYGTSSKTQDITVRVVKYLILESGNGFNPSSLTVKQGSTVYWINMDTPGVDPEIHNVVFSSGTTATSPDMMQYATYSYTFTAAETYAYHCVYHPGMTGTITVTA